MGRTWVIRLPADYKEPYGSGDSQIKTSAWRVWYLRRVFRPNSAHLGQLQNLQQQRQWYLQSVWTHGKKCAQRNYQVQGASRPSTNVYSTSCVSQEINGCRESRWIGISWGDKRNEKGLLCTNQKVACWKPYQVRSKGAVSAGKLNRRNCVG